MREEPNYAEYIKTMSEEEIYSFIRGSLIKKGKKLRFIMSGYDSKKVNCTVHNQKVLNTFAYLGIYDYTEFLFLDFYKGGSTLALKYWRDEFIFDEEFGNGNSTSQIIFKIFELTILSERAQRRRTY